MTLKEYGWHMAIATSQFFNAVFAGYPDETISSRTGRHAKERGWEVLYKILNWMDPGHCENAVGWEKSREHEPPELR